LSKALAAEGYEVEVITSHKEKQYKKVETEGLTIHYLPVYYDNLLGFTGRVYAFVKFILKAYRLAASIPDVSLCYVTSTPLTVGVIAWLLKKLHRIPFYFEVRDLWPQAPIEMGIIRNALLKQALFAFEKTIYKEADKIVALSPGIQHYIAAKVADTNKVYLIPNIADCDFFAPKANLYTSPGNYPATFTIAYFGAVGKVNGLSSLVEAARYCWEKKLHQVQFLVIGKGNEWTHIQQLASSYHLGNIQFMPHTDKYTLRQLLASVDAVYVSFAQLPVLETGSPNKFFDGLAAGKVCIVNTKGWIKELIEENNCGFYAHPDHPEQFYKQLLPYLTNKHHLKEAKASARLLAQTQFSRLILTAYFVSIFPGGRPAVAIRNAQTVAAAEGNGQY
jgi:glycosyltransferase involved in cell wall biosynthesis